MNKKKEISIFPPHTKIRNMGWSKDIVLVFFTTGLILEKEIIERCPFRAINVESEVYRRCCYI